jgi:hypothetical protein
VVLLPPKLVLLVLPLDHTPLLDEIVHHLELGDAPSLRKKVDLALLFLWSHISNRHGAYSGRRNIIFIYIIKINLLSWRAISLIKYVTP